MPVQTVDSRKSSSEHKRGSSIFTRSSSLLSRKDRWKCSSPYRLNRTVVTNWLRRGKSASRKERNEEIIVDTDDEEGEQIEYTHSRSQGYLCHIPYFVSTL